MSSSASSVAYALERAVLRAFEEAGWQVEAEPVIGATRPDLIATSPDGTTVIAEIEARTRPVHVATIAQVAAYRRAAEELRTFRHVEAALLVLGPVSPSARKAASQMEVAVLTAEGLAPSIDLLGRSADAERLAREWVRQLGEARRGEKEDDAGLREALPEVSLRHLAATYNLTDAFSHPTQRDRYVVLLRTLSKTLSAFLDHEPNPLMLRAAAAPVLIEDGEFHDYLASHVGREAVSSAEQLAALAQAAAGVLVATYLRSGGSQNV